MVSVIVPVYNRAAMIADTLASLMAQDYPHDLLEIIIVDDASTDETPTVVQAARERSVFSIVSCLHAERRGPAAARNTGIARAKGEILGFTDSDCRPSPRWVSCAVSSFRPEVGLVSGPIHPVTNPARWPGYFHHQMPEVRGENPLYPTANIFFLKKVVQTVGGFDERFTMVVGEDTDLAWRIKRSGYQSAFAEGAVVDHEASRISVGKWLREPLRNQIFPHLMAKYPELRHELLWGGCFMFRDTPAIYLALTGLITAATTGFIGAIATVLPLLYIMRSLAYYDLKDPRRWWKIPVKYVLHITRLLITVGALWYGSLRFRVLVI